MTISAWDILTYNVRVGAPLVGMGVNLSEGKGRHSENPPV
jgi:hypothetical protein